MCEPASQRCAAFASAQWPVLLCWYYARAVRTRRVVLVSLVVASACLGLAAAYADGSWRNLWLNLLAEAIGVAFIVPFVAVAPTELAALMRRPSIMSK